MMTMLSTATVSSISLHDLSSATNSLLLEKAHLVASELLAVAQQREQLQQELQHHQYHQQQHVVLYPQKGFLRGTSPRTTITITALSEGGSLPAASAATTTTTTTSTTGTPSSRSESKTSMEATRLSQMNVEQILTNANDDNENDSFIPSVSCKIMSPPSISASESMVSMECIVPLENGDDEKEMNVQTTTTPVWKLTFTYQPLHRTLTARACYVAPKQQEDGVGGEEKETALVIEEDICMQFRFLMEDSNVESSTTTASISTTTNSHNNPIHLHLLPSESSSSSHSFSSDPSLDTQSPGSTTTPCEVTFNGQSCSTCLIEMSSQQNAHENNAACLLLDCTEFDPLMVTNGCEPIVLPSMSTPQQVMLSEDEMKENIDESHDSKPSLPSSQSLSSSFSSFWVLPKPQTPNELLDNPINEASKSPTTSTTTTGLQDAMSHSLMFLFQMVRHNVLERD